jgi:hypothetical protein
VSDLDKRTKHEIAGAIISAGGRVSAGQVVALTGLPLLSVNRCLNAMAYDCGAHLQVSSDGTLSYIFGENFQLRYRLGRLQKLCAFVAARLETFFLLAAKLAFGIILTLSVSFFWGLSFLVLEIAAVFTRMESATANMRRDFFELVMSFLKLPGSKAVAARGRLPAFLESCFAFLFGPPDPNAGAGTESWRGIAQTIKMNQGVVIPEQLRVWSLEQDDEAFDLSVLVRLDGTPVVSESGFIFFSFPAFARADIEGQSVQSSSSPTFLAEKFWHFSGVQTRDLIPVLTLALANVLASNLAYFLLRALPSVAGSPGLYWGLTFMWMYGNAFLAFPLLRIFLCAYRNHRITVRNVTRKLLAEDLQFPGSELQSRLHEALLLASQLFEQSRNATLIFTTEEDSLGQLIDSGS